MSTSRSTVQEDDATPRAVTRVAEQLVESYSEGEPLRNTPGHELPIPAEVRQSLGELRELIFPGFTAKRGMSSRASMVALVEARLATLRVCLGQQLFRGLHHRCNAVGADCGRCEGAAGSITEGLISSLPALRALLLKDVGAALEGDPAASGADEVAFSYPGIWAICVYRIAHRIHELGAVIVPRIMTELAHGDTGIDIHPAAEIGEAFFIDHGTGVVIGQTTVIGARVRIYQGVTLGALSLPTGQARVIGAAKRHPTIEDDVIIYANATILGGDTVIGKGAVIGGNTWITSSVAPGARRTV
jgi:serine O-acetyltransferase